MKAEQIINGFKLLEKLENFKERKDYWRVECLCGNILNLRIDNIQSKKGCSCITVTDRCLLLDNNNKALSRSYAGYKNKAAKRNYVWNLTIEEFYNIITQNCHYCGKEPSNIAKFKDQIFVQSGIDRVDNTLGYNINNCVPCCIVCNRAKSDMSITDFKKWIINLYNKTII